MEKLGIEPSLLLAQVVNFTIIMVVLTKFLYKPILGMLEKRKKEIEESLARSDRIRVEEEKMQTRKEKLLSEARKEAREILDEAKKQGKEAEHEIVVLAHHEASEIIEKAKREVLAIHEALSHDIRSESVALAGTIAKQLLGSVLTSEVQHKLIEKYLQEAQGVVTKKAKIK